MKKMRQATILTLLLASIMSVALFYLKYEVTDLEQHLNDLNRAIVTDQESIHVLNAEWSHLNDVSRIKDLAKRYLQMNPTKPNQIKSAKDLSDGLVLKEDIKNKVPIDKTSITNRKKASPL
jgi:cell division protein FtsL